MRRRTRKRLPRLATYASVLALCIGGVTYAALQTIGKATPDRFGCFGDAPQSKTAVLFDASRPRFNEEQARSLRRYFDGLYESLGFNEELSVITTEGDQVGSVVRPRFHICGQATGPEQLEAVGAQTGQAGYLKKQRQRLYERVLAPELDALLATDPDTTRLQPHQSPILEMVADLSRSGRLSPGTRLIIVSDLIQNSDSVQFCRVKGAMPRFAVFERKPVYQERLKPGSLEGVQVEVLMLQRYGYGQGDMSYCRDEDELKTFWRDYLIANGVQGPRFVRIRMGIAGS